MENISLSADAPCEKETYQHQRDKSCEAPERDVPGDGDTAFFRKSGEIGNDAAEG